MKTAELSSTFGERVVTLCDGRAGLRGGLRVETSIPPRSESPVGTGPEPAVMDFVASDETLDRYDEVVSAEGWRLESYRRNPVFQNAHQYGDILFTLGKALVTEVREARLYQRVQFAVEVNPMARIAYGLYRGRFLNAVSVGFIPVRWETGGPDAGFRRKYLEQELLEVSAVGIPANPNALQLGLKAGAIEKADLRAVLELLRELGADGAASGTEPDAGRWLRLARLVRTALRGA